MLVLVLMLVIDPVPPVDYDHDQDYAHELMNILLIQLKRIGDLILTTPAIAALREKFPRRARSRWSFLRQSKELLPAIAGIDKVFEVAGQNR